MPKYGHQTQKYRTTSNTRISPESVASRRGARDNLSEMIQAPNRNARLIRVIVTFTTTWELGYLFIITLLPQNFEPTATRPGIDPTAIVLDNVHSTEHVLVEYARSTASSSSSHQQGALFLSPHGLLNEVEGHGLEGDMAIGTQDNNRASEESKGDIDSQTERDQVLLGDPKEQTGEQLPQQKAFGDHQWNYQQPLEEFEGPDIGLLFEYPKTPDRGDNAAGHKNNDMEHLSMSTDQDPTSSDTTGGDSALQVKRANGVFVILTHEDELQKARETVRQIEDRFNRDRNYPWIVLTPLPLTTRSRNLISQLTKGTTTFGTIPHEQWRLPKWIEAAMVRNGDYAKMRLGMNKTSLLERHRWRYMSGFLAQHKLLDQYEFFWRVDPGVCILCDVEEDPMLMLKSSGQKFAWSLLSTVNEASVPGALSLIERFKSTHPELIPDSRDEAFLVREAGDAL
ncbi:alpha 1,2-mannosyltransferase 2.4.1 [Gamsiella multidivaricata]|nr:alpha 1,2-mannosyltransferase 2.4.1 [Gamsiella multidivaricata]